jgi:serine/threonine protein kinase
MEKMNAGTLLDLIESKSEDDSEGNPLSEELASSIMMNIFSGLCLMHEKNFIHRDLKPENILLNIDLDPQTKKENIIAKIADFGLSAEYRFNIFSG